ncbi:hypothetical protein Val02_19750 [Virgisporangium aliadipatigenens]|uniref:Tachylectin 2 domain-containing protein n=1 Tax=Virgisporangium aliadipatigenens TaxID=741659 RepID=A0A8J3YGZ4_9ACTN|nr:tachylectin-related carbohydrate-binding protein [Virgisporangium aliadipatigenens]GIJ45089.1 hypothetical protein Val02_19750 [Virgisporangium aliadipatigenens]
MRTRKIALAVAALTLMTTAVAPGRAAAAQARPAPGVTGTAIGTGDKLLVGQNGNLSVITAAGDLIMYYHQDWANGDPDLGPGYDRGDGWNMFKQVISFGVNGTRDNLYLAVAHNGDMYGYYWRDSTQSWVNPTGTKIGNGWQDSTMLFAGGNREDLNDVHRVTPDGRLWWYQYRGVPGQGGSWSVGGKAIGAGWGQFRYVTASWGEFYAVLPDGLMRFYSYDRRTDEWANGGLPQDIGTGWAGGECAFRTVQAGGFRTMYAVDGAGQLRWRFHVMGPDGTHSWLPATGCGTVLEDQSLRRSSSLPVSGS